MGIFLALQSLWVNAFLMYSNISVHISYASLSEYVSCISLLCVCTLFLAVRPYVSYVSYIYIYIYIYMSMFLNLCFQCICTVRPYVSYVSVIYIFNYIYEYVSCVPLSSFMFLICRCQFVFNLSLSMDIFLVCRYQRVCFLYLCQFATFLSVSTISTNRLQTRCIPNRHDLTPGTTVSSFGGNDLPGYFSYTF